MSDAASNAIPILTVLFFAFILVVLVGSAIAHKLPRRRR
jgi:hypothetical protein